MMKLGKELQAGDVINTWAGKKRITALREYTGSLTTDFRGGARIASFDMGQGMTIANDDLFEMASFAA